MTVTARRPAHAGSASRDRQWCGIAERDHGRVFELFRRSGAQDRPGEGIGLAHVKALIRSFGGRIDLTSKLGAGTTFNVTLPHGASTAVFEDREPAPLAAE